MRPFVSVVMPMRNEEPYVAACLESVLATNYPLDRLEVLVVDGRSDDRSREIVAEIAARHPQVRLLDNPGRIIPSALNRGIEAAQGEFVVRMDVHCRYDPDYIPACVELLETTGAASVGGRQVAQGEGFVARTISAAVGSPFAAGDAKYRSGVITETEVDTVFLGAWRRQTLVDLGGFREDWHVNEDYELNVRLRAQGGRILLSPRIRSQYFSRATLRGLARQYARYGFWKAKTVRAHPQSLRWRQWVAPAFVLALLVGIGLLPFAAWPLIALLTAYTIVNLLASVRVALANDPASVLFLPLTFAIVHLAWGSGFLWGWLYFRLK